MYVVERELGTEQATEVVREVPKSLEITNFRPTHVSQLDHFNISWFRYRIWPCLGRIQPGYSPDMAII